MIEINTPGIDIAVIKKMIDEEVARHEKRMADSDDMPPPDLDSVPGAAPPVPGGDAGPGLRENGGSSPSGAPEHYTWFLKYHGREFVKIAYEHLLHRMPDAGGAKTYGEKLAGGDLTRVDVLGRLRYSREGRLKKVPVPGLLLPFLLQTLFKVPVGGMVLRILAGVYRLPVILRNIQTLENRVVDQHHLLEGAVKELRGRQEVLETRMAAMDRKLDGAYDALKADLSEIADAVTAIEEKTVVVPPADRDLFVKLPARVQEQKVALLGLEQHLQRWMKKNAPAASPESLSLAPPSPPSTDGNGAVGAIHDALYRSFEDRFRGTPEEIKKRVAVYLPQIHAAWARTAHGPVLDVGCGRGEWLELLRDNEISASGLDLNRVMVARCRAAGLDVVAADAIAHLESLPAASLSAVTGFHIVEHLPFETLVALFDQARRVLRPGGMVIFETPNPENIMVGACTFYTDPTHRNPIPPHTLSYLAEARGFVDVETMRLHPDTDVHLDDPFLNHVFTVGRDYAVLGGKA